MKVSNKQKRALEKITGKPWDSWHKDAINAYFLFTDRGQLIPPIAEAQEDFNDLLSSHHWHSTTVELWKKDFKAGLLFLDDFIGKNYPQTYVEHAFEIYYGVMGYIPSKYSTKEG